MTPRHRNQRRKGGLLPNKAKSFVRKEGTAIFADGFEKMPAKGGMTGTRELQKRGGKQRK